MFVTYIYSTNYGLFTIDIHPMEMHTSKDQSADDPISSRYAYTLDAWRIRHDSREYYLQCHMLCLQVKSFKNGDGKWHKNEKKKSVSDF